RTSSGRFSSAAVSRIVREQTSNPPAPLTTNTSPFTREGGAAASGRVSEFSTVQPDRKKRAATGQHRRVPRVMTDRSRQNRPSFCLSTDGGSIFEPSKGPAHSDAARPSLQASSSAGTETFDPPCPFVLFS